MIAFVNFNKNYVIVSLIVKNNMQLLNYVIVSLICKNSIIKLCDSFIICKNNMQLLNSIKIM
jgi:hypothetical protein